MGGCSAKLNGVRIIIHHLGADKALQFVLLTPAGMHMLRWLNQSAEVLEWAVSVNNHLGIRVEILHTLNSFLGKSPNQHQLVSPILR